jgi:5-hydroxyisourate hydrolase-like protein (transthyretin family)
MFHFFIATGSLLTQTQQEISTHVIEKTSGVPNFTVSVQGFGEPVIQ